MKITHTETELVLRFLYEGLRAHFEDGRPLGAIFPMDYPAIAALPRAAQRPLDTAIASDDALLDAVHRLESMFVCPAFYECNLPSCGGRVWCRDYNLGGTHGRDARGRRIVDEMSRSEHKEAILNRQRAAVARHE